MKNMKGQSLLEVLIGLALANIVIGAITIIVLSSLNNAQKSRDQNTATHFARQAIETLRKFSNNKRDDFLGFSGLSPITKTYCFAVSCNELSTEAGSSCGEKIGSCDDNLGVPRFTREIRLTRGSALCLAPVPRAQPDDQYVRAETFVRWKDGQCEGSLYCHEARFFTCLN